VNDAVLEDDPARLVAAVLDEEAKRQAEQAARSAEKILPDDLLPGVGAKPMTLREAIHHGGARMIILLPLIALVEEFDRLALAVLAPDIQNTLGISDTVLIGIASFGGIALVLGTVPLAWLADRMSRVRIVTIATLAGGVAVLLNGLVVNPFQMFFGRVFVGFAHSHRTPVHNSLITDTYPIPARARVFALESLARPLGLLMGPFIAGAVAEWAGGDEGWRWAFIAFALPPALLSIASLTLREPKRGRHEQELVLGKELEPPPIGAALPVSISSAYQRLKKIKTFYYICVGIGTLGFALVAVPVQLSLLLEDGYGYGAFTRGWMISLTWVASIVSIPIAGFFYDKLFRDNPTRMVRLGGVFILLYGLFMVVALRFKEPLLLISCISLANASTSAAFVCVGPTIGAVAPYRMRAQAFALVPVFIFLMGGFFGGLVAGALSDAHGERTALTIVVPPAALIGGGLFMYGSRFMKRDISLAVEELLEEQDELRRMSARPDEIPLLQVRNLDYSYGPVQVLFDVGFELQHGEVLALLGTNGAGKSTLLRAISGLGIPDRGVVRLTGRTLTYAEAELRFKVGIVQLRGGAGTFPDLSIRDNLRSCLMSSKISDAAMDVKIDEVLRLFPALTDRRSELARDLSGGQQQMLALAMALVHEPEVLLIDELSLGLAPVVVQELLLIVEQLKARGQAMIIVEQSLNVALAFADRAIFMEKGRVRFEGDARELAERDDLVRAVFLGGEGG
jgi:ABC-type branched-subunit amino acid transport system ATPase component/predicted MFS family arabinose efflux permease